jgi:hypothetical protein
MGDKYKQGCVVFFRSWTLFLQIVPCSNIVSCQSIIRCIKLPNPSLTQWNTMLGCMISFALERWIPHTFVAITRNNDVVWSMSWTHLLWLHWRFLHYFTHSSKRFLCGGGWTLKVGYDTSFFPHWGRYHSMS